MEMIDLSKYAPIISDRKVGEKIRNEIMLLNPQINEIEINMGGIISMTTYCAELIFGYFYNLLGFVKFEKQIKLKNATEDILLIKEIGIRNAIMKKLQ